MLIDIIRYCLFFQWVSKKVQSQWESRTTAFSEFLVALPIRNRVKKYRKKNRYYLVGPYYAGPKSTPAHFTPALIPPRENFDLPPFSAAFNATIRKIRKKARFLIYNNNYFVFNVFFSPPNKIFDDKVPSVGLLLWFYFNIYTPEMFQIIQTQTINEMCQQGPA